MDAINRLHRTLDDAHFTVTQLEPTSFGELVLKITIESNPDTTSNLSLPFRQLNNICNEHVGDRLWSLKKNRSYKRETTLCAWTLVGKLPRVDEFGEYINYFGKDKQEAERKAREAARAIKERLQLVVSLPLQIIFNLHTDDTK